MLERAIPTRTHRTRATVLSIPSMSRLLPLIFNTNARCRSVTIGFVMTCAQSLIYLLEDWKFNGHYGCERFLAETASNVWVYGGKTLRLGEPNHQR